MTRGQRAIQGLYGRLGMSGAFFFFFAPLPARRPAFCSAFRGVCVGPLPATFSLEDACSYCVESADEGSLAWLVSAARGAWHHGRSAAPKAGPALCWVHARPVLAGALVPRTLTSEVEESSKTAASYTKNSRAGVFEANEKKVGRKEAVSGASDMLWRPSPEIMGSLKRIPPQRSVRFQPMGLQKSTW
ncbi:hypothetical protein MPH_08592 [Macrophomina phaseolina MS6]|uniref:Uncharacterized protein n=1 Tax=Macrophomina phaseolina (strain MS6) TaxID=1126212 RepID=K2RN12_MACPH|nr:hypothetical protein MPH_08592 [Macrophomina phaseolina MS6]